ncbi:MAG: VapE domain-containing protein [Anaerolineae bacterium]
MYLTITDLPDRKDDKHSGEPRTAQNLTTSNLMYVLNGLELEVRYNMMTRRQTFTYQGELIPEDRQEPAYLALRDTLINLDIRSLGALDEMLRILALQNRYHPMQEWLENLPPHEGDPIGDVLASVQTTYPEFWELALPLWLVQTVQAVCGWEEPQTLPYCLVLQGGQGIGKSHFFASLGGEWIKREAEVVVGDEDSELRNLRWPMVEMAELDGVTRKADRAKLKAFLSRPIDDLRRKYGKDAQLTPRTTAFCGTVNNTAFLNDETGARRFLPLRVESIDWSFKVDFEGLWAQAYAMWTEDGFVGLTGEETAMAARAAEAFTLTSPEVDALEALWEIHGEDYERYAPMTKREICRMLDLPTSMASCAAVSEWMTQRFGGAKKVQNRKNCWPIPVPRGKELLAGGHNFVDKSVAMRTLLARRR